MTGLLELFLERAATAGGGVSAVVLDAGGGEALTIAADEPRRSASVIKLPLVMTLYEDAAAGRLDLDEQVPVGIRVAGSGVLSHLPGVERMTVRDLAAISISVSDNTATNRLIEVVGIDHVNERLDGWGCPATRLRRAMYDLDAKARGLENVMTARETASLLRRVLVGAGKGDAAFSSVLTLLTRNSDRSRLGRYLPSTVALAHKDGWDTAPPIDNDAGVVAGSVVAVGFTNGIETRSARSLLGLLGLAAAEIAGADIGTLPSEVGRSA